jgi:outer membrane protein assembly factor BamB
VALAVMAFVAVACGSGDDSTQASVDDSTTASTAVAGAVTAPPCPGGEFPALGAVDLEAGVVAWSSCSPVEAYRTIVGASDAVVLVEMSGPSGHSTIAFDAAEGSELWRWSTREAPNPPGPVAGQGTVVLAADDGGSAALVGVDAQTGEERWRLDSDETVLGHSDEVAVLGPPPAGFVSRSGIRGIDRATGTELWETDLALEDLSGVGVARGPAAVLDDVIALPTGTSVTAVEISTGEELWTAPQLDHPAAADGVVVGARGSLAAIDAESGAELWTAPGRSSYGDLLALGDGAAIVLGMGGEIVAYELQSGAERWQVPRSSGAEPQLVNGTVVVMLWEGQLVGLSTTDGSTIWSATEPFRSPLMNSVGSNATSVFVAINSLPWSD